MCAEKGENKISQGGGGGVASIRCTTEINLFICFLLRHKVQDANKVTDSNHP